MDLLLVLYNFGMSLLVWPPWDQIKLYAAPRPKWVSHPCSSHCFVLFQMLKRSNWTPFEWPEQCSSSTKCSTMWTPLVQVSLKWVESWSHSDFWICETEYSTSKYFSWQLLRNHSVEIQLAFFRSGLLFIWTSSYWKLFFIYILCGPSSQTHYTLL